MSAITARASATTIREVADKLQAFDNRSDLYSFVTYIRDNLPGVLRLVADHIEKQQDTFFTLEAQAVPKDR